MYRRSLLVSLLVGFIAVGALPLAAAGADPPLPSSLAAVGDSISQAASSGGSLGTDYPANSWSTGTNTTVNSHYARLTALNPAIAGQAHNDSVSGAKMADLAGQIGVVVGQQPAYLTVLMGGNDLCTATVAQMTTVADFATQFTAAVDKLTAGSPTTNVYVVSIPNVYQLWVLFHANWWARTVWSGGNVCQSLLANPTSTQTVDVQRRAQVAQRNVDDNAALAQVCAQYARCHFDGNAVYNVTFATSDVAGDYFHPSISGQAKIAAVSWAAGYWPNGAPPPDAPPTPSFTASCTALACAFDASGSSDDHGIVSYGWNFGDNATGSGVTTPHTYAAGGTFAVTLTVTDTIGQTASLAKNVTVAAAAGATMHLASATGSATVRKSGWTAKVAVQVADPQGLPVSGATVSGTWSTGGTGTCVTQSPGTCSFSANLGSKTSSVTWTVNSIVAAGYSYNATDNLLSAVTISKP